MEPRLGSLRETIIERTDDKQASRLEACRVIAFGSKPCGGPWRYLAYSAEATDSVGLTALVDEFNQLEARLNEEEGRASDCSMVQRPQIVWREGRCATEP